MPEIQLTQGKVAIVDHIDYEFLTQWKWYANKMGKDYRVQRNASSGESKQTKKIRMHMVIAQRMGIDSTLVDHADRDTLNNRRENLRGATVSQNNHNQGTQSNNTSGYPGVCWDKKAGKWIARVKNQGKRIHVGYFDSLILASYMRDKKKRELAGAFTPKEIQDA
jgi:hypothetical protein